MQFVSLMEALCRRHGLEVVVERGEREGCLNIYAKVPELSIKNVSSE